MAHLLLGRCRVTMGQMQDFTTRIQRWEQDVMETPYAPSFHGVYLERDDPSAVVIELRFGDREQADACLAAGHIDTLHDEVMACTNQAPTEFVRYDLFYGADNRGERIVFGEPGHHGGAAPSG